MCCTGIDGFGAVCFECLGRLSKSAGRINHIIENNCYFIANITDQMHYFSNVGAGAALVDYGISRGDLALMGAVTGVGVGVLQALVLARHGISGAFWWAVANPPAWALGWFVTSYVISRNIDERFANFGVSGALVFGLLTWVVLAFWLHRTKPEAIAATG